MNGIGWSRLARNWRSSIDWEAIGLNPELVDLLAECEPPVLGKSIANQCITTHDSGLAEWAEGDAG